MPWPSRPCCLRSTTALILCGNAALARGLAAFSRHVVAVGIADGDADPAVAHDELTDDQAGETTVFDETIAKQVEAMIAGHDLGEDAAQRDLVTKTDLIADQFDPPLAGQVDTQCVTSAR